MFVSLVNGMDDGGECGVRYVSVAELQGFDGDFLGDVCWTIRLLVRLRESRMKKVRLVDLLPC
jgi:hypothetical protein